MTEPNLELEPLPPELVRLLGAEKARAAPPAAMQARVLERLGAGVLELAPLASARAGTASVQALRWPRLPIATALLVVGGLGGAGLHALIQSRSERSPSVTSAPTSATTSAVAPPSPVTASSEPVAPPAPLGGASPVARAAPVRKRAVESHPVPSVAPTPVPSSERPQATQAEVEAQLAKDQELAAERALLEQARTALARGKPRDALVLLSRHGQVFPAGRLAEERQALEILSLLGNRQAGTAHARAAEFRRQYPKSMMLRTIDAAFSDAASSAPTSLPRP